MDKDRAVEDTIARLRHLEDLALSLELKIRQLVLDLREILEED